jgi:hypothetical protein
LGNLYVGGQKISGTTSEGAEILVYAPGAIGTPTPSQTITAGLQALIGNSISAIAIVGLPMASNYKAAILQSHAWLRMLIGGDLCGQFIVDGASIAAVKLSPRRLAAISGLGGTMVRLADTKRNIPRRMKRSYSARHNGEDGSLIISALQNLLTLSYWQE